MTRKRILRASLLRSGLLALGAALVLGQGASAQSGVLHGRVMGANGAVPDLPVALHRVLPDGSGSMLDQTVTDSTGRFQFQVAMTGDSAVYFAATRMDNNLFVGPPMKGELPTGEYVIDVGPNAEAIPMGTGGDNTPVAGELASGPEAGGGGGYGYGWLGVLALIVVGVSIGIITWSRRPRLSMAEGQRSRLVRLASLEEEYADRLDDLDPAERARYEEQRTELRNELLGR